jgi:hypothetical protein
MEMSFGTAVPRLFCGRAMNAPLGAVSDALVTSSPILTVACRAPPLYLCCATSSNERLLRTASAPCVLLTGWHSDDAVAAYSSFQVHSAHIAAQPPILSRSPRTTLFCLIAPISLNTPVLPEEASAGKPSEQTTRKSASLHACSPNGCYARQYP